MEGKFAFHVFFLTCPQPAAINSRGLGIGSIFKQSYTILEVLFFALSDIMLQPQLPQHEELLSDL
jgi:hypothetical protein